MKYLFVKTYYFVRTFNGRFSVFGLKIIRTEKPNFN